MVDHAQGQPDGGEIQQNVEAEFIGAVDPDIERRQRDPEHDP